MSLKWKDVTSWSRGDSDETRKTPRTYEARAASFRLTVSRHIHLDAADWMLSCSGVVDGVNAFSLVKPGTVVTAEFAQVLLEGLVKSRLELALRSLS